MYLFPLNVSAQFRIVGLLNVGDSKPTGSSKLAIYKSSAQGRGFSVDEGLKKFLIQPKNIIRVHVIGDIDESDLIPEMDRILRGKLSKPKPKDQRPPATVHNKTILSVKKPPKADKVFYPSKRPYFQRRNFVQSAKEKYQVKEKLAVPESVNRSSDHNPVQSKYHKVSKRNRYKSRCRCERLSNCPRIQLSVSSCEPNYFLCCF